MKKVIARLYIKSELIEAFKKQAVIIIEKTRTEKGCVFYSLFQDIASPGEFLFYEEYVDQAALDVHSKSEYLQAFRVGISNMQVKEKVVEII